MKSVGIKSVGCMQNILSSLSFQAQSRVAFLVSQWTGSINAAENDMKLSDHVFNC